MILCKDIFNQLCIFFLIPEDFIWINVTVWTVKGRDKKKYGPESKSSEGKREVKVAFHVIKRNILLFVADWNRYETASSFEALEQTD